MRNVSSSSKNKEQERVAALAKLKNSSKSKFVQSSKITINPEFNEPDNYSYNWDVFFNFWFFFLENVFIF